MVSTTRNRAFPLSIRSQANEEMDAKNVGTRRDFVTGYVWPAGDLRGSSDHHGLPFSTFLKWRVAGRSWSEHQSGARPPKKQGHLQAVVFSFSPLFPKGEGVRSG